MLNYLCIPEIPIGHHVLSFLLFLGSIYYNFVENFSSVFTKDFGRLFLFMSYFGIRVILVSQNKLIRIPSFSIFLEECVELPLFLIFGRIHRQGRGILVGCRLWGRTESDTTEAT